MQAGIEEEGGEEDGRKEGGGTEGVKSLSFLPLPIFLVFPLLEKCVRSPGECTLLCSAVQ